MPKNNSSNNKWIVEIEGKKYNIRKLLKEIQKAELRLKKKNQKMMELNKLKKMREAEIEDLNSKIKDLEYLLKEKNKEIEDLKLGYSAQYEERIKELEEENKRLKSKIEELEKELSKKDAIIELLQKPEYDYKGIVSLEIEQIKTKWIGWPEGAVLEEIDYILINNSTEPLKDVTAELYVEDEHGNSFKVEGIKIKKILEPKERIARKLNLFKHLKKKGTYKIEFRIFIGGHEKEVAEQTKILII